MGLLTNRYDTISGINKSMQDQAFGWGRMSQPKYAGMAASAGLQGDMAGRGLGMMLGGQDPLMQKQDLIDEIMRKHPDPKTPEELEAVANDLQAAGLTDLAMEVRGVANATKTANAATTKANAPSADLYKNLGSALSTQVLTTQFLNSYLRKVQPALAGAFDEDKHGTYTQYTKERKNYRDDLEGLFTQWANSKKYTGVDKDTLATLINDDAAMTADFIEWIKHHGNVELGEFMITEIMGGTSQGDDDSDPSGLSIIEGYVAKGLDETDNMVITQRKVISNYTLEDVNRNLKTILGRNQDSLSDVDKVRLELLKEKKAQLEKLAKESSQSNDAQSSTMAAGATPYTPEDAEKYMTSWFMPD
jgi:hypothetical protein